MFQRLFPKNPSARLLTTLIGASIGTAVFWLLHLPLPFLFGPMTGCLLLALAGAPLRGLGQVGAGARTILGIAVGASLTPAIVGQLPSMALSLSLVPIYILAIGLVGVPYFRRLCGYDTATAWYASMPGGLQDMVLFGQEAGAIRALFRSSTRPGCSSS